MEAKLYDANNIETLTWPSTADGEYAKKFLTPLVKNSVSHYINNIDVEAFVLKIEDFVFPVLVTTENYTNSWVCSPYAHYIAYGKESAGLAGNPIFSSILRNLLNGLGKISRIHKMNSIAYVNNWMFSTDLYPEGLSSDQIHQIVDLLKKKFPKHAIVLRSLNEKTTPAVMEAVSKTKFHLIASRYVFVTDTQNDSIFKTRIMKSDMKLWKESPYQIIDEVDLQPEEWGDLLNLYHQLYVMEHSHLQPQFNYEYFKVLLDKRLLKFKVLKEGDQIKGVAGFYRRDNVMMCPIFGYDKRASDSNVVYRLLNTALILEAQKEGLLFNQSAGAAFFKSVRRAEGFLEYMAIYTDHLPAYRQFFWSTLKFFINKVGSKYMKKY